MSTKLYGVGERQEHEAQLKLPFDRGVGQSLPCGRGIDRTLSRMEGLIAGQFLRWPMTSP